ncbi:MAG: uracil-xanthine permease family protein [Butyrivibrio sp.]|nr:uracil-xanthine permease family protein [Acetatifactor muris]MCM1559691.1 uracil-xanthine permease family protein [Butyrivibrio sp.]
MSKKKSALGESGIYDAKVLGAPKVAVLGLQHMFAMFGSTILVPVLTGLDVSTTLFFAGVGTLLFHFLTKRNVPAFLGSSFAFLAGYHAIAGNPMDNPSTLQPGLLPYACFGVACSGLLYLLLALLIKLFGTKKVMKFFPPVVTGPIIIAIGLTLSQTAIDSCSSDWLIALTAIVLIVICNIWGRGMLKIVPIIVGVLGSYLLAVILQRVDFTSVADAAWIGLPIHWDSTVFWAFGDGNVSMLITSVITIMPIALATIVEHVGDISAISSTVGKNYIKDPGLHRTLLGDGLATIAASLFGAPANTTYGENTGVLSLTKVFDPMVIRLAAGFAILFSFCPKFAAVIGCMPSATVGGVSLVLYGMISAVGVRNVVESHCDFSKSRNVIIAALILVLSIGIKYSAAGAIAFTVGSVTISLSGLAVGALVGIILNAVLPGKDYVFSEDEPRDTGVNFAVMNKEKD